MRIEMHKLTVFLLLLTGCASTDHTTSITSTHRDRPNILFIMCDDHGTQAIGAYGGRLVAPLNPTPTLDRLASEGMRFDNVFCTNSICTPSRASILTGQYSHINGVRDLYDALPGDRNDLPREMQSAGYATAVVGAANADQVRQSLAWMNEPIDRALLDEVHQILKPNHSRPWHSGKQENGSETLTRSNNE
jgi:arylsulfatase A-like enzyme